MVLPFDFMHMGITMVSESLLGKFKERSKHLVYSVVIHVYEKGKQPPFLSNPFFLYDLYGILPGLLILVSSSV